MAQYCNCPAESIERGSSQQLVSASNLQAMQLDQAVVERIVPFCQ